MRMSYGGWHGPGDEKWHLAWSQFVPLRLHQGKISAVSVAQLGPSCRAPYRWEMGVFIIWELVLNRYPMSALVRPWTSILYQDYVTVFLLQCWRSLYYFFRQGTATPNEHSIFRLKKSLSIAHYAPSLITQFGMIHFFHLYYYAVMTPHHVVPPLLVQPKNI